VGRLKVVVVSDQFILYIIKFYLQQLRYIGFLNFRGARGFFEGTYMGGRREGV
jgi:predicted RNA-binding protein with PUA domain